MSTHLCRYCSSKLIKRKNRKKNIINQEQFQCKKCNRYQTIASVPQHIQRSANILLLDIETLPMEVYAWNPKQEYIPPGMVIKDWSISCWAAKELFSPETKGQVVTPQEAFDRTEESIVGGIWKLMDWAHIVITQNGINFDIRRLNTKFLKWGYPPPSPYKNVDTLVVARSVFAHSYNRLDELGKEFGIGKKLPMDFSDWAHCLTNDKSAKEALAHKLEYCKNDIAPLLEDVYLKMLPWIPGHPNLGIYTNHDGDVCPKCESSHLSWNTEYATPQGSWMGFRCQACGATGRGTTKDYNIKKVHIVP